MAGQLGADQVFQRAGYYGGIGLSWVVEAFNPELMVIGGGLTHMGSLLLEPQWLTTAGEVGILLLDTESKCIVLQFVVDSYR